VLGDFPSQASIRQMAKDVLARYDRLDVLVNNAGAVNASRTVTQDGIEATFAVNHLGPFLLTNLLLDLLKHSAPARIVNVSSVGHYRGTLDFDDLGYERGGYQIMSAYSRSKLANVLFTRSLARRLDGSGVTANALHPGAVATNIWSGAPWYAKPVLALYKRFAMISPAEGAETITYLAVSPQIEGKTGLYFENNKPKEPSKLAQDDALAQRLWDESARLVGGLARFGGDGVGQVVELRRDEIPEARERPRQPSYLAGNLLNLLLHLGIGLRGYNFSNLCVWQAYLRGADLPGLDFIHADLTGSVFTDYAGAVTSVAFSPDGRLLAAGADSGAIYFWRVTDRQLVGIGQGHHRDIQGVRFLDGRRFAAGVHDD
jgi:NAD(P)-dependent dehydrogenase (short-subunit alcohol dehydrogenase family)